MRSFRTEGIIIKRTNFGEADRILTILTKESGKIKVKATGVRKISSRRSSHVELLNHSILFIYKGRGNLPVLTEAQTIESFQNIKEDLTKIGFAYHICELIDGLCPEQQENRQIFTLFLTTIKKLLKEEEIALVIHEFEVELLTLLGFWPKDRPTQNINMQYVIENIIERKLKSKPLISKLRQN